MSLAEHVVAVITRDTERFALIERSFAQVTAKVRAVQVDDAAGAMQLPPVNDCASAPERTIPHLIVLDAWPSCQSRAAMQQIRAADALADARVIVLCDREGDVDIAQAYALGANSCLTVSPDPDEFVAVMREAGRYWLLLNRWPTW